MTAIPTPETRVVQIKIKNSTKWCRTDLIKIRCNLPDSIKNPQIYNSQNQEILSQMVKIENNQEKKVELRFVAENIPPHSFIIYTIKNRDPTAELHLPEEGLLDGNDYYLENDAFRVVIEENGLLTIMHREAEHDRNICGESPKIIAMEEELTEGSIWAGDQFFNLTHCNKIQIPSKIVQYCQKSQLLEANDFKGTLSAEFEIQNEDQNFPLVLYYSIEKGENTLISCDLQTSEKVHLDMITLVFTPSLQVHEINKLEGGHILWDSNLKHGFALIGNTIDAILDQTPQNSKILFTLHSSNEDLKGKGHYKYAILPLNSQNMKDNALDFDYISQKISEYFTPFSWEITYL